jgi:hypothetical protein
MWMTIATIGLLQTWCFLAFVRRRSAQQLPVQLAQTA